MTVPMSAIATLVVQIVENEMPLAFDLGQVVREAGCREVGHAFTSTETAELAQELHPAFARRWGLGELPKAM